MFETNPAALWVAVKQFELEFDGLRAHCNEGGSGFPVPTHDGSSAQEPRPFRIVRTHSTATKVKITHRFTRTSRREQPGFQFAPPSLVVAYLSRALKGHPDFVETAQEP